MAATTPKSKNSATWLMIGLAYEQPPTMLRLIITFTNTSLVAQEFSFSNQTRKAELLGLLILTSLGQRVIPTHNLVIKPLESVADKPLLAAGACFTYVLSGNLTESGLEFPGARFELHKEETYQLQFRYAGQQSNTITIAY